MNNTPYNITGDHLNPANTSTFKNTGSAPEFKTTKGVTKPELIAKYATTALIIGTITNGKNIVGFKTIGNPNDTGSLIPNNPGINATFPTALSDDPLGAIISISTTNARVEPDPPIIA